MKGLPALVEVQNVCLQCGKTIPFEDRYCDLHQVWVDFNVPRDEFGRFIIHEDRARCAARSIAISSVPTENGWFDARARLTKYYKHLACVGINVLGGVSAMTDEQVERDLRAHGLDGE